MTDALLASLGQMDFAQALIIVLLGMLFFKEVILERLMPKLGLPVPAGAKAEEEPPVWAQTLLDYFNHDTTAHHEESHRKLDELLRLARESKTSLDNLDKYGVKCRTKDV